MEEPGKDTTRFDSLIPTIVRPQGVPPTTSTAPSGVDNLGFSATTELLWELGDSDSVV